MTCAERPWPVSLGPQLWERLAYSEVQGRWHFRVTNRHGGRQGAEQQRHQRRRQRNSGTLLAGRYDRGSEDTIYIVNRQNLTELGRVGTVGRQAGEFHWPHVVAADGEGNLYAGEVDGAGRVQKFLRYGPTACSGTGSAEVGKYIQ